MVHGCRSGGARVNPGLEAMAAGERLSLAFLLVPGELRSVDVNLNDPRALQQAVEGLELAPSL